MGKRIFLTCCCVAWLLLCGATSCSVQTHYIGKSYPSTDHPEIFLDWKDVPCDYETMGRIEASIVLFGSPEKAQAAIEREARAKGADAMVFTLLYDQSTPTTVTTTEATHRDASGERSHTDVTTTSAPARDRLTAIFIKYKQ